MVKMVNFMLHYFTTTKKIFQIKKALLLKRGKFNLFKVFFNYARGVYGRTFSAGSTETRGPRRPPRACLQLILATETASGHFNS